MSRELYEAAECLIRAREKSVLIVEDTAAHAAIIQRAFDRQLWTLEHVTRGEDTKQALDRDSNRILILDLSLPDIGGLELLKALLGKYPELGVVVVTSTNEVAVSVEAMKLGATNYVVKGDPEHTIGRIKSAVEETVQNRIRNAEHRLELAVKGSNEKTTPLAATAKEVSLRLENDIASPAYGLMALAESLKLDCDRGNLGSAEEIKKSIVAFEQGTKALLDSIQNLVEDLGKGS